MHGGVTGKAREGLPMSIGIGFALVNPWGEPRDHPGSGKTPIGIGSVGVLFFLASSLHL